MRSFATIVTVVALSLSLAPADGAAQIQEGDTLSFWSVAYVDWQPDSIPPQRQVTAVCNRVGDECYVFIDTLVTTIIPQIRIDEMVDEYDNNFARNLPPLYGPIPDEFDNDPRVFILIIQEQMWTGYFDPIQQMPDSMVYDLWGKRSTEREIIYVSQMAFTYQNEQVVVAHELGHMIHWGQDHSPEPPENPTYYWEDGWIDESFSNFAPVYLIEDVEVPDVMDRQAFFSSNPDLPLIHFIAYESYNQMKLWSTFMYEHYGADFTSTLIQDQENGIPGVRNTLAALGYSETFEDTFEHWVLANYLDDPDFQGGRYSYNHYNFGWRALTGNHDSYPVDPRTETVAAYAADYIRFTTDHPVVINFEFTGDSSSVFRIAAMMFDSHDSEVTDIQRLSLDPQNTGSIEIGTLGLSYDEIVIAVMNCDSTLGEYDSAEYSYSVEAEVVGIIGDGGSAPGHNIPYAAALRQNYPNPFNPSTSISFDVPGLPGTLQAVSLRIYDIHGRLVRNLVDLDLEPGIHVVAWNGRNERGEQVPSGIYLYTLRSGGETYTKKMTVMK